MFAYPKQAEFNRIVPKTKIYAHARPTKRIKNLFVTEVDEIVWKYKLSPETINLPARNGVHEIDVFEIALKSGQFHVEILQTIDQAIPFPILFQVRHGSDVRFAATYKRPVDPDGSNWMVDATFQTERRPLQEERPPLPVALDLAGLYEQMVRRHIPLPARASESLAEQVVRFRTIEAKKREREKLAGRLEREKQFNRRVELNAALRSISQELENLHSL